MQLVMFSKHLQSYSVVEAGRIVRELGFAGVDLTVRPGGHVEPAAVEHALPEAVQQLREEGLVVPMVTTALTDAADPAAEAIIAAAAACEIRELKLGYWRYEGFGTLRSQLDAAREKLDGLERLAAKHGVRVSIHTHSGKFLSAEAGNVYLLLHGRDPRHVGAYLDPGHMTLEGGAAGWMQGLDLLQEYLSMVAVKSFGFLTERNAETGEVTWTDKLVPLREGTVRWREVFACLRQLGWDGILTIHSEYQGAHSWRDLNVEELIAQTRDDLGYLLPIIRGAGYHV